MKEEGKSALKMGLVTYFKGKKIDDTYHIYSRVKDKIKPLEFNTHIKINLVTKRLEVECSCDEFKEFKSKGYTLKCSHIVATSYKFLSLVSKGKKAPEKKIIKRHEEPGGESAFKLIRKKEKNFVYYELQSGFRGENRIIEPNDLREFLKQVESKKIKFKFDYIEFVVPIFNKDLPLTFNLKEKNNSIVVTTHKKLPISLSPNNDVFYFKDELYLPSERQIEKYIDIHHKLENNKQIAYRKDIDNYIKLVSHLSSISQDINIDEELKKFAATMLKYEFFVYEEKDKIYCDVLLKYGNIKINILNKKNSVLRDYKEEEKLIMKIERNSFVKHGNRFMFTGKDKELLNILKRSQDSICSLGKVTMGKELEDLKVYKFESIKGDFYKRDGYYDFSYSIGNMTEKELEHAFKAYKNKKKFYKTKENNFLDFEDSSIRGFFNTLEALRMSDNEEYGHIKLEEGKALFLYKTIKDGEFKAVNGYADIKAIEDKLSSINNREIAIPKGFKGKLREYQIKGFKWFKTLSELGFGGILADEMGLGKTIQTIAFLLSEKSKKALIVCPTSLIYNWKEEILRFAPELRVLIVHGPKRTYDMDEYDIILTSYGTLRMDIHKYKNVIFDYCIIDEAQNIKNPSAKNTIVIKRIKAYTRFALTGTPIENNLTELWSIFDFLMPGYLYSREKFEEKFVFGEEDNLESLKLLIAPFILRRTKKEVVAELPDKIEKKFIVEMTSAQRIVYAEYIKSVKAMMKNHKDGRVQIFSYLTRLRQICLDPSLILEDYNGGSGKLKTALEIIRGHEGKVLLFSQFTSALYKIEECLRKEKIKFFHLDGSTKPQDRINMVNDFNSNNAIKVFLISLKAGGTGLNLTSANLVIHFDPWWNPAVENQATDRAHRIGQKNVVEVIKLVAKGTIEEKIILLQEDKKELIDNVITGELQNSKLLGSLSKEELIELFDRE
ncbi:MULTISPECIES: DEAD/DEAH box helicase [Clostridium]|uniref:DNA/RNA helicase, SNF2 n=2 Tax=Clostridium acetobutylicum TaxID=1488 RepID=Q97DN1_CLOAB|nr:MULTISPECIES: DEAD/DEAH box helicase [Clostridium]AAK81371.1 DNA/RNA helicase, SNF2 [Clostridium acetobutylicum ATCC 824]AEI32849.1 DNA/RNA helicase, SNF2 [Clostridium acetobutylicum DSM 1731]AWV82235.1 ATP-dependent helicase [Clostridium acetobutylicum]MBC2393715.1 DEAD/DEAH box helicase [Clostridium acetobutylicum]MBC2584312.1 DEAD/DEAH box helicase [Clostridium acetobutylicum]